MCVCACVCEGACVYVCVWVHGCEGTLYVYVGTRSSTCEIACWVDQTSHSGGKASILEL